MFVGIKNLLYKLWLNQLRSPDTTRLGIEGRNELAEFPSFLLHVQKKEAFYTLYFLLTLVRLPSFFAAKEQKKRGYFTLNRGSVLFRCKIYKKNEASIWFSKCVYMTFQRKKGLRSLRSLRPSIIPNNFYEQTCTYDFLDGESSFF